MEFTVKLESAMKFHIIWLIVGLLLIAAGVLIIFILKGLRPAGKKKASNVNTQAASGFFAIRQEYLARLTKLRGSYNKNKISLRDSYHELSAISRGFVSEVTGKDALKMTLSELKRLDYNTLADLISECYEPEFAYFSDKDFKKSCDEAWRLISQWK